MMGDLNPNRTWIRWLLLLSVTAGLAPGTAHAVPITAFITIQPIDVCTDNPENGTDCAVMNNLDPIQNILNNVHTAGPNVQVGFASNGINITNQIYNLLGINVVFQPTEEYDNTSYQNLQVTASTTHPGRFDSVQLQQLTDQPALSQLTPPPMHLDPPIPLPLPNRLNTVLSPNPTTLNMLFVKSLIPDPSTPGTLFGLSWIGNNGIAIGENAFGLFSTAAQQTVLARADTIAHEIGHNLGLDHPTFGNDPQTRQDLLTSGDTRRKPIVTVSDFATQANAFWLTQIVPNGSVGQLLPTQVSQVVNPFGLTDANGNPILNAFLNPISNINTMITDPGGVSDFSVSFANSGRTNEFLKTLTLTAPAGFLLDPSLFAQLHLPGDTSGITVTLGDPNCTTSCTLIFGGNPFVLGDTIDYTIGVCAPGEDSSCVEVSSNDLAGGTYTYLFSDGYKTTSLLQSSGEGILDATTWNSDPAIAPEIVDPSSFVGAGAGRPPCVPIPPATTCPALVLADADPAEEGTAAVPEPPSIGIILTSLVFWLMLDYRRRLSRRATPRELFRPLGITLVVPTRRSTPVIQPFVEIASALRSSQ